VFYAKEILRLTKRKICFFAQKNSIMSFPNKFVHTELRCNIFLNTDPDLLLLIFSLHISSFCLYVWPHLFVYFFFLSLGVGASVCMCVFTFSIPLFSFSFFAHFQSERKQFVKVSHAENAFDQALQACNLLLQLQCAH
jgi:hypothetical protein